MKVVCAWCEHQGAAQVLCEKEPQDDPAISHGICDDHVLVVLDEVRRSQLTGHWSELRAS